MACRSKCVKIAKNKKRKEKSVQMGKNGRKERVRHRQKGISKNWKEKNNSSRVERGGVNCTSQTRGPHWLVTMGNGDKKQNIWRKIVHESDESLMKRTVFFLSSVYWMGWGDERERERVQNNGIEQLNMGYSCMRCSAVRSLLPWPMGREWRGLGVRWELDRCSGVCVQW